MSITMHTGRPGTGKTYNLVREAIKLLNGGEKVWSNFFIKWEGYKEKRTIIKKILYFLRIKKQWNEYPKSNLQFWTTLPDLYKIQQGTILMDEAHVYFNSRRWKDLPEEMERKLAQHRKEGLHIIGTVQAIGRLDVVFRELIDFWFVYQNNLWAFTRWEFDLDQDKQKKYPLSKRWYLKNKKIYSLYDTLAKIEKPST